ncbi:hypothetical protein JOB18_025733 [Solea senegalensis]|uniref:Uncharacterized protein n=1 Tax=Solea senegalensis TaxID=28829 RepID=A0AAV6PDK1_SOLSE|nr:hypothetical protein JOB18_025733 [Solea senegalensis]
MTGGLVAKNTISDFFPITTGLKQGCFFPLPWGHDPQASRHCLWYPTLLPNGQRSLQHRTPPRPPTHHPDLISIESVLARASLPSIESAVALHRLRWAGHVIRMSTARLPRQILFNQLESGTRSGGAPKRRFCDQLKATLLRCGIDHANWETPAEDCTEWSLPGNRPHGE